jgi:hypothetical protein
MTSIQCFLIRKGNPASFQFVEFSSTTRQVVAIPFPSNSGQWTVKHTIPSEEDCEKAKQLNGRHGRVIQFWNHCLVHSENPTRRWSVCQTDRTSLPVRSGSYQISVSSIVTPEFQTAFSDFQVDIPQIREGISIEIPSVPEDVFDEPTGFLAPRKSRLVVVTNKPLPLYSASMIARALIQEGKECPISMDALSSFPTILIPPCGHGCGPTAKQLEKCPVCREPCAWTEVEVQN